MINNPLYFCFHAAHGYVTSFCEDSPGIGTFQYRLLGFKDPPTDYYPRAFFMAAHEGAHSKRNPHCYGSEKIYNYHLDLARKIYEQYPERKKFLFHFPGKIQLTCNLQSWPNVCGSRAIINNYWMRLSMISRIIQTEVNVIRRSEAEADNIDRGLNNS